MDNIAIREYAETYKDEIIELILNIQQNEFGISIRKEDQPDLADIKNFYQTGSGNFWVALCQDKVVGTISLKDIGNQRGALRKMFVKSEYRGIQFKTAQYLLDSLLVWTHIHALTDIYLGTTEKFLAAHRFYEKNNFECISSDKLPPNFPIMKVDTRFYHLKLPFNLTSAAGQLAEVVSLHSLL
ncbi:MAG: GNAT family N-acetyltransferase [Synergistaceae bacterium]|jgi:N-acetylglutamate synthase-like GNAT family acetyltransferase|nr:GNAT family N-acetyltransferase [Synergistaceae bacterium]